MSIVILSNYGSAVGGIGDDPAVATGAGKQTKGAVRRVLRRHRLFALIPFLLFAACTGAMGAARQTALEPRTYCAYGEIVAGRDTPPQVVVQFTSKPIAAPDGTTAVNIPFHPGVLICTQRDSILSAEADSAAIRA